MPVRAFIGAIVALTPAVPLLAAADFRVTEVYTGVTGEDGTPDWFELTNFGDMPGSTAGLFYDDSSADPTVNDPLPTITLGPGESAVFIIDPEASDDATFTNSVVEFQAVWGSGITVVAFASEVDGALGQGGDAVFIFDSNAAGATVVDSLTYPNLALNGLLTYEDPDGLGTAGRESVLGENGAFESNAFFNDNIGGPTDSLTLTGSPGLVPEPGTAVLLGLAGVALAARRRR